VVKGNSKLLGGTVSHFGFGLFLLGVLISQGEKKVISINKSDINFGKEFKENEKMENILLLKDSSLVMGDYRVTYIGTREEKPNHFYEVKYERKDSASGKVKEEFVLLPNAQLNPKMGLIANPDTKHYLTKDVFTHVSSVPDNSNLKDTTLLANVGVGDSFFTKTSLVIVEALNPNPVLPDGYDKNGKLMVGVNLKVSDSKSKTYKAQPVFIIDMTNGNSFTSIPAEVKEQGLTIDVTGIDPNTKKLSLSIRETERPIDFIIMKAIVFPYINLVWLGGIITFIGALISMWKRTQENKAA
jgi:cytochrome c-type biogenesis protein CcmF